MGKHLVPLTMILGMCGFAVAAIFAGFVPSHPLWWRAAISLAVLGGIAPMIYAVNIRVVPVFARRPWRDLNHLRWQVGLLESGAWTVFAGRLMSNDWVVFTGSCLALASGLVFTVNIARLFRQEPSGPSAPLPFAEQAVVDRLAVKFTRWAGIYLLVGLIVGVATSRWHPREGRWDLVWAHALLVGFFLSMAAGTMYHVLGRWTGRPWRAVWPIRAHLLVTTLGFPVMLLALATGRDSLFMIAGPLQAAAIVLFLTTIAPLAICLPNLSRWAVLTGEAMLIAGVGLGASFAIHPVLGARLRLAHAEINLFGWAGLLISGVSYYLAPRFAGRPLKWPKLAPVQIAFLAAGAGFGAAGFAMRAYGHDAGRLIMLSQLLMATGFALLGGLIAGTFFVGNPRRTTATVTAITIGTRTRPGATLSPAGKMPPR